MNTYGTSPFSKQQERKHQLDLETGDTDRQTVTQCSGETSDTQEEEKSDGSGEGEGADSVKEHNHREPRQLQLTAEEERLFIAGLQQLSEELDNSLSGLKDDKTASSDTGDPPDDN